MSPVLHIICMLLKPNSKGFVLKNLKVAFLTYGFGKKALGIGKYSWHLVKELRELGCHVDVFTTNFHFKGFGPPIFYFKNIFLRLKNYDLIHSNEGSGVFVPHHCMIETYHHDYKQNYDINSLIFNELETIQCHKVKQIIVPSFMTKNQLLHKGFSEDKISVIYHGVDHDVFMNKQNSRVIFREKYGISDYFVVMNVGQLIKRKRQIDIIKALQGIPNTIFLLIGNGEEEKNIKKLAWEKKVRLIHFKFVPESLLVNLYNAADVYIHTSILEGFGLTVLEAMACGLPVIAYKVADFERILKGSGILLQPGDVDGIRQACEFLKVETTQKKRTAQLSQQESKNYTWKKSAKKHLQTYMKVLS